MSKTNFFVIGLILASLFWAITAKAETGVWYEGNSSSYVGEGVQNGVNLKFLSRQYSFGSGNVYVAVASSTNNPTCTETISDNYDYAVNCNADLTDPLGCTLQAVIPPYACYEAGDAAISEKLMDISILNFSTSTTNQSQQNLFLGIFLFITSMWFVVWTFNNSLKNK